MPGSPARKPGDRETGGGLALPVWIGYMQTALKDVPQVPQVPPEGVMNVNGEGYYDEFGPANADHRPGAGRQAAAADDR